MVEGEGVRKHATIWKIPDALWALLQPEVPAEEFEPSGGRPWTPPRLIVDGVLFVLRTGCQWKAVPAEYGSGSTLHRRFQHWVELGVWERMWQRLLEYYDEAKGLEWTWQSADSSLHKAPLGGEKNRAQPYRPSEKWDQAPRPHRRRRRSDRAHRDGRQPARQAGVD
jgi:transposase